MRGRLRITALAASVAGGLVIGIPVAVSAHPSGDRRDHGHHHHAIKHVVLISVDGLHQSDLSWYVQNHPGSELATLAGGGAQYVHASTPIPSDSFPGMVGQVTGGNPKTTGVYYDAEYNHNLLPAGTTSCAGKPAGASGRERGTQALDGKAADHADRPRHAAGRPEDLQAGLSAPVPEGQHGL